MGRGPLMMESDARSHLNAESIIVDGGLIVARLEDKT